jgi:Fe-S-cluster-containing dehydrogenase component
MSTACKSENEVPLGVYRTWVKYVETGAYPDTRRHFQVTRCNHCANPPCVRICPTQAMYQRADGIVEFDNSVCIGCKACMQACPYDAIYIDPEATRRPSATTAPTAPTSAWSRPAWSFAPNTPSSPGT